MGQSDRQRQRWVKSKETNKKKKKQRASCAGERAMYLLRPPHRGAPFYVCRPLRALDGRGSFVLRAIDNSFLGNSH